MESADRITLNLSILDKNFRDEMLKEAATLSRRYGFEVYQPYFGPAFDAEAAEQAPVIMLELGMNLAVSPFANWLYDRLRGRSDSKIKIDGTEIPVEKETIERIVEAGMKARSRKTTL
jgi:hypothetical protein